MKAILIGAALIAISLLFVSSPAFAAGKVKECPMQTITSAYIDVQHTKTKEVDLGKTYQDFMNKVESLRMSKNFKGFKLVNHNIDLQPDYSNKEFTRVMIRASIEFDLNYQAITELSKLIPSATINVSTYDSRICDKKHSH